MSLINLIVVVDWVKKNVVSYILLGFYWNLQTTRPTSPQRSLYINKFEEAPKDVAALNSDDYLHTVLVSRIESAIHE